jgi:cytoskeletal protein CcmA (bactofilin family)
MSEHPFLEALQAPANDGPVVLGPTASLIGCLALPGDVIVQGHVEGEIKASGVLVSACGTISGTVVTTEFIVEGQVLDSLIFADRVVLRDGAYVTGEIWHRELVLEAGHIFEGKSRRHEDPKSLAPCQPHGPEMIAQPTDANEEEFGELALVNEGSTAEAESDN